MDKIEMALVWKCECLSIICLGHGVIDGIGGSRICTSHTGKCHLDRFFAPDFRQSLSTVYLYRKP